MLDEHSGKILGVVVLVLVGVLVRRYSASIKRNKPFEVSYDHPFVIEAIKEAKATIPFFTGERTIEGAKKEIKATIEKDGFDLTHSWGEVKGIEGNTLLVEYEVLSITSGEDSELVVKREDIIDWRVTLDNGQFEGAFTEKAFFSMAREKFGCLPDYMKEDEKKYF